MKLLNRFFNFLDGRDNTSSRPHPTIDVVTQQVPEKVILERGTPPPPYVEPSVFVEKCYKCYTKFTYQNLHVYKKYDSSMYNFVDCPVCNYNLLLDTKIAYYPPGDMYEI